MIPRLALAPLALAACLAEPPDEPAAACPLTAPVRLAAPPEGWRLEDSGPPSLVSVTPEQLVYTFGFTLQQGVEYWQIAPCGGEPRLALWSAQPHLQRLVDIDTPAGPVSYWRDLIAEQVLMTREDLAEPRQVVGLPRGELRAWWWPGQALFLQDQRPGVGQAAGIGAPTQIVHAHDGDPERPALRLVDDVVEFTGQDDDLLVLRDDGELLRIDPATGDAAAVLAGVRAFALHDQTLVWQALGDDRSEPMYLRRLDTGDEVLLGLNDFCPLSWGRDPTSLFSPAGRWYFHADHRVLVLAGPEGGLARAHWADTGAVITIPAHDLASVVADGVFALLSQPTPDTLIHTLWEPATGAQHEWYRGPTSAAPRLFAYDGAAIEYLVVDDALVDVGSLWRLDLASGERTEVLPRMRPVYRPLDDGRWIVAFPSAGLSSFVDLVVVDRDDRSYDLFAAAVYDPRPLVSGDGYAYFDLLGPEPGLWVTPIPPN
jgi:hypothetical protein